MDSIVETHQLTKRYGSFLALDGCDFAVRRHSIFGMLGPNGAGKTTLIRTLLGFIRPDRGRATIAGFDCVHDSLRVRQQVAYLPAEAKLFRMMRGHDALEFFSRIHPLGAWERARRIADLLALDLSRRVAFMSTGMRQKLAIASALSCRAPLLILDEPTANLDPTVRDVVLSLIREAHRDGATIWFSSHILSEIEELCNDVVIMRGGRVVERLSLEEFPTAHRILGIPRDRHADPFGGELPEEWLILEKGPAQWSIEIHGPLEKHLERIQRLPWRRLRIESNGLKRIYESCSVSS